jgi:hypothetical protein
MPRPPAAPHPPPLHQLAPHPHPQIERYNALLLRVRRSCAELQSGLRGASVMSAELDAVAAALLDGRVPSGWLRAYPSLKPLGAWARDLLARLEQLARWAEGSYPRVYWLGGLTYPTGFLTAVLQTAARRAGVPIDALGFEYGVISATERELAGPPKEGVSVKGLFLEGGGGGGPGAGGGGAGAGASRAGRGCHVQAIPKPVISLRGPDPHHNTPSTLARPRARPPGPPGAGWDYGAGTLAEPRPMELIVPMPVLHFRPVEAKKRAGRGVYACPMYLCPVRAAGRERPSLVGHVDLRAGAAEPEHWVMRGAALLLSLAA